MPPASISDLTIDLAWVKASNQLITMLGSGTPPGAAPKLALERRKALTTARNRRQEPAFIEPMLLLRTGLRLQCASADRSRLLAPYRKARNAPAWQAGVPLPWDLGCCVRDGRSEFAWVMRGRYRRRFGDTREIAKSSRTLRCVRK